MQRYTNYIDRYVVAYCMGHLIETELAEFRQEWNCHKIDQVQKQYCLLEYLMIITKCHNPMVCNTFRECYCTVCACYFRCQ